MHIITITADGLRERLTASGKEDELTDYREVIALIREAGAVILEGDTYNAHLCVLIETRALLDVLLSIRRLPKEVVLRVFSLQAPDGQLVGLKESACPADANSYNLRSPAPTS
jgi:hypothetical protein